MASTWLSEPEGSRPTPDWGQIVAFLGMCLVFVASAALCAFGLVTAWTAGAGWGVALGVVGVVAFGLLVGLFVQLVWRDYRNPSSYGGGWDWY